MSSTAADVGTQREPKVLISRERIHARVEELGQEIARDYPEGPIHLIGILKGACIFLSDLARAIPAPSRVRLDFMGISSYGLSSRSSGEVKVTKDLDISIEDRHVIVVEDIIDTGITLNYLTHMLEQRKPRSVRIAALLDKPSRRQRDIRAAYVGFSIPDEFVVGYGLDYAETYRNLPDVCVVEVGH